MRFNRYAIFHAPPPEAPWVQFATSWLGWDMQAGQDVAQPHLPGLTVPLAEVTDAPRRYGLHGTLKAPFRLAPGSSQSDLVSACAALCRRLSPLPLGALRLTRLGRFLALCPSPSPELSALAAACVRQLDPLRAPLSQDEMDRRRPTSLTPRQLANLQSWGYPHVLEDFRFHITLTGRLSKPDLTAVEAALEQSLMPLMPHQTMLGDLALAGEDAQGRFHLLRRFELSG